MNHELRYCASRSANRIDITFLYQGLHEFPSRLNRYVREALDSIEDSRLDYILLNYGLCGNGTLDISHPSLPIIIHNIHDCITPILGDAQKYRYYMRRHPGTFWFSCGWIEGFPLPGSPDYAEKYDEFYSMDIDERKRDVIERMLIENYTHLAYIRWDELGDKINKKGKEYTKSCVKSLNDRFDMVMQFDEVKGSPDLLQRFVDGDWEGGDFIVLQPGQKLRLDAVNGVLFGK